MKARRPKNAGIFVAREVRATCALAILLCFPSCVSQLERDPSDLQPLPEAYGTRGKEKTAPEDDTPEWWRSFRRKDLNALESRALTDNLDLAIAWERLRQSEAFARQAGADLYPHADLGASHQRRWVNSGNPPVNDFNGSVEVRYEVDLWGKIRAGRNAAGKEARASYDDWASTGLTLSASVANRWVEIIEAERRIDLVKEQLGINTTQLDLIELRFRIGQSNLLDVYQQRQTVARTTSNIPAAEEELAIARHSLNLLLGQPATAGLDVDTSRVPVLPPLPATGVPSDLLTQRPDVRAALLRIESADWNVAEAKADRLPSIGLTASSATTAETFETLFTDWQTILLSRLVAPVLDGGRRKWEVEKQKAVASQALAEFRKAVLTALKEVEDALVSEEKIRDQLDAIRAEAKLARETHQEALNRYLNGLTDYLNVSSSLVNLQSLEREEISAVARLFKARISLHRALGGGF